MTPTWHTLRDYALRITTFAAVALTSLFAAFGVACLLAWSAHELWPTWAAANAVVIAWTLMALCLVSLFGYAIPLLRIRKTWLWRRFWIDVD